jgi:hypothetical protein
MDFIRRSPSGDITIKSRTTVNWVRVRINITKISYDENFSFMSVDSELILKFCNYSCLFYQNGFGTAR